MGNLFSASGGVFFWLQVRAATLEPEMFFVVHVFFPPFSFGLPPARTRVRGAPSWCAIQHPSPPAPHDVPNPLSPSYLARTSKV